MSRSPSPKKQNFQRKNSYQNSQRADTEHTNLGYGVSIPVLKITEEHSSIPTSIKRHKLKSNFMHNINISRQKRFATRMATDPNIPLRKLIDGNYLNGYIRMKSKAPTYKRELNKFSDFISEISKNNKNDPQLTNFIMKQKML